MGSPAKDIDQPFLGVGVYTSTDAARLTGVSGTSIRNWLRSETTFVSQLDELDGTRAVGFLDLMELRVARALHVRHGLGWRLIRRIWQRARDHFDSPHPFATKQFKTDGHSVFTSSVPEPKTPSERQKLIDLRDGQHMLDIVRPALLDDVDYAGDGIAAAWWPRGRRSQVVLDPKRDFGQPIVSHSGVRAEVLAAAATGYENDFGTVAKWYEVTQAEVRHAVEFHREGPRTAA